ncbi:MAG: peptide deformylase [Chloroflexota bacterium]
MSELPIVTVPDQILRQKARPVTEFGPDFQKLVDNMFETLHIADGVGLAAPQIGLPLQLAVIESLPDVDDDGNEIEGSREQFVIANPEIVWTSRDVVDGIEGCLSIPGYLGEVTRYESIRVRAQDRHGRKVRLRLREWTARIFQHEIDHLNGVLYIDRLTAPENVWTEEEFEVMREAAAQDDETADESAVVGD